MTPSTQVLADHGRSTHKLAEKWRADCKKAKELGAAAPLPPYQQKRLEARKGTARGLESDSSEEERAAADMVEAEAAEQEAGAANETPADATHNAEDKMCDAPPRTHDERALLEIARIRTQQLTAMICVLFVPPCLSRARRRRAAIRAKDAQPNRPSFLAV